MTEEVSGGQTYLSAPEKSLTFGLGEASKIDSLEIRQPDGQTEVQSDLGGGMRPVAEQHPR
jgi:hypothetical protein